jgi:hypothetical protein
MAMSKRERVLVSLVGAVVAIFGLQFLINSFRGKLEAKQLLVDQTAAEVENLQLVKMRGDFASGRLQQLRSKSLPSAPDVAVAQYRNWLTNTAQACGVQDIVLDVSNTTAARNAAFTTHRFELKGNCRLDNLVKLLAAYYDRDYLHRVRSLKLSNYRENLDWVNISLTSEAISLVGAKADQPPSEKSSGRLAKTIEGYQASILGRNPFSPPNQPPRFNVASSIEVPRDREWSLELQATDPDPAHVVKYDVLSELPEGLRFSPNGRLSWTPTANGSYELLVQATDSGFPAKSAQTKLTLRVTDPPKPPPPPAEPPKFDPATQTFVSAMLNGRTGAEAWIRSKTDNNIFKVAVGDDINIGSVKGKIVEVNVDDQFLLIETEGRRWTLGMGDYLEPTFKKSQIE